MKHEDYVVHAAFSPDGRRIVTASDDKRRGSGTPPPAAHLSADEARGSCDHAAFSPDGRRVVTASDDKTARVWDAATGLPISPPMKHEDNVTTPRSAPTGVASSPPAETRRRGSGTPPPDSPSLRR